MLRSMTAYGRAVVPTFFGRLSVEIQSVNRRFLEVQVVLPRELSRFEMHVRKWVSAALSRGQVSVRIIAHFDESTPVSPVANVALARQLGAVWKEIADCSGLDGTPTVAMLAQVPDLIVYEENESGVESYIEDLQVGVESALKELMGMRENEGKALFTDLITRLEAVRQGLKVVESFKGAATDRYRQKLLTRIEELSPGLLDNDERLLREVGVFAEKVDISEELTRLQCHVDQFEAAMRSGNQGVGKTLDFISQEMFREANTVGAKVSDYQAAEAIVNVKSELERIREQLQNVE